MSETPEEVVIPAGALASSAVRVDTWLWATRQLKSRSQATAAVRAGHVRVNGEPVKAAYKVRVGDEVRLRIEGFDRILGVNLLLNKRSLLWHIVELHGPLAAVPPAKALASCGVGVPPGCWLRHDRRFSFWHQCNQSVRFITHAI